MNKKYKTEDARLKKFVATMFLEFKMVDNKYIMSQVQILQIIIHDLLAEDLIINKAFQVVAFIKKLSFLWRDFKNYLKYKLNQMMLEALIICLWIEENNKIAEKKANVKSSITGENYIEVPPRKKNRKKSDEERMHQKKDKLKKRFYNCGKFDLMSSVCHTPKKDKKKEKAKSRQSVFNALRV